MSKKINNFLMFIALILAYIIYQVVIILFLNLIGIDIESLSIHKKNICLILIDISLMIITYLIYRHELNTELTKYLKNFKDNFSFGLKMWLLGIFLMISTNLLIQTLFPSAVATNEEAVQESLKLTPVYVAFAACIFAPFMEEMIFRKALKKVFNNSLIFILVSGFLFGFVHTIESFGTIGMLYIIPYGLFGAIFAYTYTKTKSIFVPITFHFIHNTMLIVFSLINMGVLK